MARLRCPCEHSLRKINTVVVANAAAAPLTSFHNTAGTHCKIPLLSHTHIHTCVKSAFLRGKNTFKTEEIHSPCPVLHSTFTTHPVRKETAQLFSLLPSKVVEAVSQICNENVKLHLHRRYKSLHTSLLQKNGARRNHVSNFSSFNVSWNVTKSIKKQNILGGGEI